MPPFFPGIGSLIYDDYTNYSGDRIGVSNCDKNQDITYVVFRNENWLYGSIKIAYKVVDSYRLECGTETQRATAALAVKFSSIVYDGISVASTQTMDFFGTCDSWVRVSAFSEVSTNARAEVWEEKATKTLVVTYRGTQIDSIENWSSNLNFITTACNIGTQSCGQLHNGFLDVYDTVGAQIRTLLKSYSPTYKLIVTGHSLGGAAATLFAYDAYFNQNFAKISLITFGSPRVGDTDFELAMVKKAQGLSAPIWRFTSAHSALGPDPVSLMPPMSFDFRHVQYPTILAVGGTINRITLHMIADSYMPAIFKSLATQAKLGCIPNPVIASPSNSSVTPSVTLPQSIRITPTSSRVSTSSTINGVASNSASILLGPAPGPGTTTVVAFAPTTAVQLSSTTTTIIQYNCMKYFYKLYKLLLTIEQRPLHL